MEPVSVELTGVRLIKVPRYVADVFHKAPPGSYIAYLQGPQKFVVIDSENPNLPDEDSNHSMQNSLADNQFILAKGDSEEKPPSLRGKVLSSHVILPNAKSRRIERQVEQRAAERKKETDALLATVLASGSTVPERKSMPFKFRESERDDDDEDGDGDSDDYSGSDRGSDDEGGSGGRAQKRKKEKKKGRGSGAASKAIISAEDLRDLLFEYLENAPTGRTLKELSLKTGQTQTAIREALKDIADLKSVEHNGSKAQRYVIKDAYARHNPNSRPPMEEEPAAKRVRQA